MALEAERTVISVNGIAVPGVNRNGVFLGESPVTTFLVFRSFNFTANQQKTFWVEFPCTPKTILFNDTNNTSTYTITITSTDGSILTLTFDPASITRFGNVKLVNFPPVVLDKGTKITVQSNNAFQSFICFANLAYNIDVKDF